MGGGGGVSLHEICVCTEPLLSTFTFITCFCCCFIINDNHIDMVKVWDLRDAIYICFPSACILNPPLHTSHAHL